MNQYYNCPPTLDKRANPCHTNSMKKTTPLSFNAHGIAASDERLASIAMECIRAERLALEADRAARALGANQSTWSVNW